MNREDRENDVLEQLLRESLASDAMPAADFTDRLMEQVRRTPQEKPLKKQPVVKLLAALAACAVIAAAIPLVIPRMGGQSAASMDCAAPEAAMDTADDCADGDNNQMEYATTPEPDSIGGAPDNGRESQLKQDEVPGDNDSVQSLTLVGQDARDAKAALDDMDIQPAKTETGRYIYDLTQQQAAELGERVDALHGIDGSVKLILEVAE